MPTSVKRAVSYISDYEEKLVELAVANKCHGVICGHIHQPAIRMYGKTEYLNSGDWVESMSALVENYEGKWDLVFYKFEEGAHPEPEDLETEDENDVAFADEATMAILAKQLPRRKFVQEIDTSEAEPETNPAYESPIRRRSGAES